MEFINESGLDFINISSEAARTYEFPSGAKVTIYNPLKLHVAKSGSARIFDAEGVSHYIPPIFIHLSWIAKDGQPNFVR